MQITEPSTLITDYLLAILCFVFAYRLLADPGRRKLSALLFWSGAFVFTGIAAVAGGSQHGFRLMWPGDVGQIVWTATLVAIGAASFCFFSSAVLARLSGGLRRVLFTLAVIQLIGYIAWIVGHADFRYAVYDYVPSMVGVLILQLRPLIARRDRGAGWIIVGIVVSFAAAAVQMAGLSIHRHFNHNDLYHVIQMGGMYCFYRGGLLFEDRHI